MLRTALRNVLAHKARLIMTVLAVCLGVAFITGSLVFADSTTAAYRAAMSRDFADIAVRVMPKDPPGASLNEQSSALDDTLVSKLSTVPGVASVRPAAEGSVTPSAKDGTPMRADSMQGKFGDSYIPGADGKDSRYPLTAGRAPRNSGEVALDRGTAAAGGYVLGDTVTLAKDGPVLKKRLVGLVSSNDSQVKAGGNLAVLDKATAQKLFAAPGHYNRIDLTAKPGTSQFELADRITAVLPADRAEATTGSAQAEQQSVYIGGRTHSYERLPLIFAAVSLFIQRVTDVPGVRTTSAVADSVISAGAYAKDISGVAPKSVDDVMKLHFLSGSAKDLGPGRVAVSQSFAHDHGVTTGEWIKASIGPGTGDRDRPYTVVGVYQDNPTAQDVLGSRADVQKDSYLPHSVQRVLVRTTDGAVSKDLEKHLRAAVSDSPLLKVQDRDQLVQEQAGVAGELMTMMYGLLAIGVLISALGMINTLAMSISERTREIGVLRAIGMDRSGISRMIRLEAVCVAAFGTLLGLAGGLFGSWKVSGLMNGAIPQYSFSPPWPTLALVVLLSLAVGAVAAALPARRAAALSPLRAVADA
ncbi:ABC transporter permease [Streptomyces sp. CY1]|uniref:ABC transporter permease n=1 Tax=Streptomyces sp. CY1 TaxID=3388313 RepID=UPI0039A0070F